MPKWKDPKTFNVETEIQTNVDGMGVKEGIGLRWSQGFGLDELDVWLKCWWWTNPRLINWHP